ncbi:MAG: hypothetical protein IT352_07415 [Gemmatimonadales bacterium]|nr:hypothetical protein [Gemmatimonadales bacterium]
MKTVARATAPARYQPAEPVARNPVRRTLAVMRGMTEGSAHQWMMTVESNALTLMHACRSAGQEDRGQRFLADLRAALSPRAPKLTPELIRAAQEADAAEEELETRYLLDPTPATARAWRIGIETAAARADDLARALRAIEEA